MIFDSILFLLFLSPVVWIILVARTKGRRWGAAWLLTIAPLYVPLAEDGFLSVWLGMATPSMDPHGMAGTIEPHAAGHVIGAGIASIALGVLCASTARGPFLRGDPWAWRALLSVGVIVSVMGLVELIGFFDHGSPIPGLGQHGGFGWGLWIAGFVAWGTGLWLGRPQSARESKIAISRSGHR